MSEQINLFYEFLDSEYHHELVRQASKGNKFLKVDFSKLSQYNPELAELLLEEPEDTIKAAELAIGNFDLEGDTKSFKVRFFNLPESQKVSIRNIRSAHIDKLVEFDGLVRQKSDVRPQVTSARFECPACGNIITVLQTDTVFKEPSRCSCGRKGRFRTISKELIDAQRIVLEEAPEDLEGGEQPKRLAIFLKSDLVSPLSDKKTNPGSKVRVNGVIKEIPIEQHGIKTTKFDLFLDTNFVEAVQEDFYELEISEEEEQAILDLAKDPNIFERLRESLAPSIYGHEKVKEAIILQMMGGVSKKRDKGDTTRGDMHILLIGDPGSGKSQLLKKVSSVAPKSRYVSGKGASGAGLTASVVKDEFLKGWALEAGALVLTNKGICCTSEETEFITEDFKVMSFRELFENRVENFVYPKFKVLGLDQKTNRISPFKIKRAFRIPNNKKVYEITTKTGRRIKLTEDNEVLGITKDGRKWIETGRMKKGDYLAVPKNLKYDGKDDFSEEFAYIAGLIASDGHVKLDSKNAMSSFYNTNPQLISIFRYFMGFIGEKCAVRKIVRGRKSTIRGKEVISQKDSYQAYNNQKGFARNLIGFGIPSGNKSSDKSLDRKILGYSNQTLAFFMKGVFDGDGSIRENPYEVTITTGIEDNARLFQLILQRMGMISSVKRSTNSWHCDIRGTNPCLDFFNRIGTNHEKKFRRFLSINALETKDRLDVIPHSQTFFKGIVKKYEWKLGAWLYKYFWNYTKEGVAPSKHKLSELNKLLGDEKLAAVIEEDILWDQITSIREVNEKFVYDFTMEGTNNFIGNNIIMHNCIDELDKMTKEDQVAMHEGLEQQTITIAKANIQATLKAETTVLAAANPKMGRFDPYELIAKQIDLPPTILNRFDLIFAIRDLPSKENDSKLANFLLNLHQSEEKREGDIEPDMIKKYVSYARRKRPKLTDAALKEIKEYYVTMRNGGNEDGKIRAIPISARQLEALIRLSEASAKAELRSKVTKKDSKRAIDLLHYSLSQIGLDPETGKIDIDTLTTGITASQRSHVVTVKEIINELEKVFGKSIPLEDVERECELRGVEKDKTNEIIEKLKKSGDIYSPRHGVISKIE